MAAPSCSPPPTGSHADGLAPVAVVAALHGVDLDPLAVEVTRTALVLWAARAGLRGDDLVTAATRDPATGWSRATPSTARGRGRATSTSSSATRPSAASSAGRRPGGARPRSTARALLGGSAAGYADTAGLFLVRAAAACAAGGRVAMLQPLSFLGSRDAGAVRRRLEELAVLEEVWLADERVFGAAVDVCAPVLRVAGPLAAPEPEGRVRVTTGDSADVIEVDRDRLDRAGTWAPIVAAATGVPTVALPGRPVLGGLARATAGFRDEFYALAPFVSDLADPEAPVDPSSPLPELPAGPRPAGDQRTGRAGPHGLGSAHDAPRRHPPAGARRRRRRPAGLVRGPRRRPPPGRLGRRPPAAQDRRRDPDEGGRGRRRRRRVVVAVGAGRVGGARPRTRRRGAALAGGGGAVRAAGERLGRRALGRHRARRPRPQAVGPAGGRGARCRSTATRGPRALASSGWSGPPPTSTNGPLAWPRPAGC